MIENLNTTYILIGVCAVLALLFVMYIWKSNRNTTPQVGSDSDSHNDNESNYDGRSDEDMRHVEPSSTEEEICEGGICRMPNEVDKTNHMIRANVPYVQPEHDDITRMQLPQSDEMPVFP